MVQAWYCVTARAPRMAVGDRIAAVLENVGPSITITSLTNCLAFGKDVTLVHEYRFELAGIGGLTPTPEIRLFARTAAVAMAMDYFYEITFFAAWMVIAAKFEHNRTPSLVLEVEDAETRQRFATKPTPADEVIATKSRAVKSQTQHRPELSSARSLTRLFAPIAVFCTIRPPWW